MSCQYCNCKIQGEQSVHESYCYCLWKNSIDRELDKIREKLNLNDENWRNEQKQRKIYFKQFFIPQLLNNFYKGSRILIIKQQQPQQQLDLNLIQILASLDVSNIQKGQYQPEKNVEEKRTINPPYSPNPQSSPKSSEKICIPELQQQQKPIKQNQFQPEQREKPQSQQSLDVTPVKTSKTKQQKVKPQPEKNQEEKLTNNPPSSLIESGSEKDPNVIAEPEKQKDSNLDQQFQPERHNDPQNELKENEQQEDLEIIISLQSDSDSLQSDSDSWCKRIFPECNNLFASEYNCRRHFSEVHQKIPVRNMKLKKNIRKNKKSRNIKKGQKKP